MFHQHSAPGTETNRTRTSSIALRITALGLVASLASTQPGLAQLHVPGDFPTIQQAVDAAASGMTITVAAGQYEEQVLIEGKDLKLRGAPGATLVSPTDLVEVDLGSPAAPARKPVLAVTLGHVDIKGFAFDGLRRGDSNFRFTGILYVSSSGTIRNCSLTGFRSSALAFSPSPERAIQMVNPTLGGAGVVRVSVRSCSFSDNVDSIFIGGGQDVDPSAVTMVCSLSRNVIVGLGPQPARSQTGIFVASGATGIIRGNHISGHEYLGSDNFSIGVLTGSLGLPPGFVMPRLLILGNTLENNSIGILSLFADRNVILHNTVTGGMFGFSGIGVTGERNWVLRNSIHMDQSVVPGNSGVLLGGAEFNSVFGTGFAINTRIIANTISGAAQPIWSQTGVTGTIMHSNVILP